jgi:CspA family cold shock protein
VNIGVIKWYIPNKGYGFIQPKDGGRDIFLHVSALQKANINSLSKEYLEGLWVGYEIQLDRDNRELATNIKLVISDTE